MSYGLGAVLQLRPEQLFCAAYPSTTLAQKQARREAMRAAMAKVGIPSYPGRAWQPSEQAAWNAYNQKRGLKPMLFGKYPMGQQCNALFNDPNKVEPSRTEAAFAGFGGTFAPDCWLAGNPARIDAPGKPSPAANRLSAIKAHPANGGAVFDRCQGSASPLDCTNQNLLSKPFLGRPCQAEWKAWYAAPPPPAMPTGGAQLDYAAAPDAPSDNTLLYAGAAAAVVVAGAAFFLLKKK